MFSGIISDIGTIKTTQNIKDSRRFCIACKYNESQLTLGASVACSGICLTVTDIEKTNDGLCFNVDVSQETLSITTANTWQQGDEINLELSLKIGDELGGHFVSGHVDGLAEITSIQEIGAMWQIELKTEPHLMRLIAKKGSITIDGVSLTVNEVKADQFSLMLIPYSLQNTIFKNRNVGETCNLEIDMLMRYIAHLQKG